jgi:hypothetical protein
MQYSAGGGEWEGPWSERPMNRPIPEALQPEKKAAEEIRTE